MNSLQREILHICGLAMAPAFRVRGFREHAMRHAAIAAGWGDNLDENYPALKAKHLDNASLFATWEDLISSMRL
jgi:hypothetical protein